MPYALPCIKGMLPINGTYCRVAFVSGFLLFVLQQSPDYLSSALFFLLWSNETAWGILDVFVVVLLPFVYRGLGGLEVGVSQCGVPVLLV